MTLTFRLTSSPTLPPPSTFLPLLISKGYITIDGASLTLIDVSPPKGGRIQIGNGDSSSREEISGDEKEIVEFSIMLIKHTQEIIGLSRKKVGEKVNLEFDVMGKYAVRNRGIEGQNPIGNGNGNGNVKGGEGLEEMIERIVRKILNEKK